ncbi:MAG TPA: hypothetical protein VF142_03540, partial [Longimicrobium sp.]
ISSIARRRPSRHSSLTIAQAIGARDLGTAGDEPLAFTLDNRRKLVPHPGPAKEISHVLTGSPIDLTVPLLRGAGFRAPPEQTLSYGVKSMPK